MFHSVLLLEDEPAVAGLIRDGLRSTGMDVATATDLHEAREYMRHGPRTPELCLVDRILPDGDGLDFVREVRTEWPDVAIVVLTGMGEPENVVAGLDGGADLYLTKPFTTPELTAHLRALHRRAGQQDRRYLRLGDIVLDKVERTVRAGERSVRLTDVEARLLAALLVRRGEVARRSELFSEVWELDFDPGTGLLHSHVRNLRTRLKPLGLSDLVAAVRGVGYRLDPPVSR